MRNFDASESSGSNENPLYPVNVKPEISLISVPSMASRRLLNHSGNNKVYNFHSPEPIRGRSTRLVSLRKIINTILSVPRPPHLPDEMPSSHGFNVLDHHENKKKSDCKLFGFDLNLPPCSPPSSPPPPPPSSESEWNTIAAFECSSAADCDPTGPGNSRREDGPETGITGGDAEKTEICAVETQPSDLRNRTVSSEDNKRNVFVPRGGEGCLELLIEAAKLISDDEVETAPVSKSDDSRKRKASMQMGNDSISGKKRRSKRLRDIASITAAAAAAEAAAAAPVEGKNVSGGATRSRSGRCQVVPLKYRDDSSSISAAAIRR